MQVQLLQELRQLQPQLHFKYTTATTTTTTKTTTTTTTKTTTTTTTKTTTTTITLQLQQNQPHHNYNYNCNYCTAPHYIQELWAGWPLQPLQSLQKAQLQPPFNPSVGSLCHFCATPTHLSYSVLSLKLPPPPCAVLLVFDVDTCNGSILG